jgi:hypothetical protein
MTIPFSNLDGHQYMTLTTFRKSGVAVPTPVWFAAEGDKLYVVSRGYAGKVKRMRHTAKVTVAPCTREGQVLGEAVEARVRILPAAEKDVAYQALLGKYAQQLTNALSRDPYIERVFIEVAPMA